MAVIRVSRFDGLGTRVLTGAVLIELCRPPECGRWVSWNAYVLWSTGIFDVS